MPFQSRAQQRYLFATNPVVARRWADHTPDIKALPERTRKKREKRSAVEELATLAAGEKTALYPNQPATPTAPGMPTGPRQQDVSASVAPPAQQPLTPTQAPSPPPQAPPQQQQPPAAPAAPPGGLKPSPLLAVPHPPSPIGDRLSALHRLFVPQATPPMKTANDPRTVRDLLGLAMREGRTHVLAAIKTADENGGWYLPPGTGRPWPQGLPTGNAPQGFTPYNRVPTYPGTPVQGYSPLQGMQPGQPSQPYGYQGYGMGIPPSQQAQNDPHKQLDRRAQQLQMALANGRIQPHAYQMQMDKLEQARSYLPDPRAEEFYGSGSGGMGAQGLPGAGGAGVAGNPFEMPASANTTPTWEGVQAQRKAHTDEYAKRLGLQNQVSQLQTEGAKLDRSGYMDKFQNMPVSSLKATDPAAYEQIREKWINDTATRLAGTPQNSPGFAQMTPESQAAHQQKIDALKQELVKNNDWAQGEKMPINQLVDPTRLGEIQKGYEGRYVDPAFRRYQDNPAFQLLQRDAKGPDLAKAQSAQARLDKMKSNFGSRYGRAELLADPQFQIMMDNEPEKAHEMLNHVDTWQQYQQQKAQQDKQWADAEAQWNAYNAQQEQKAKQPGGDNSGGAAGVGVGGLGKPKRPQMAGVSKVNPDNPAATVGIHPEGLDTVYAEQKPGGEAGLAQAGETGDPMARINELAIKAQKPPAPTTSQAQLPAGTITGVNTALPSGTGEAEPRPPAKRQPLIGGQFPALPGGLQSPLPSPQGEKGPEGFSDPNHRTGLDQFMPAGWKNPRTSEVTPGATDNPFVNPPPVEEGQQGNPFADPAARGGQPPNTATPQPPASGNWLPWNQSGAGAATPAPTAKQAPTQQVRGNQGWEFQTLPGQAGAPAEQYGDGVQRAGPGSRLARMFPDLFGSAQAANEPQDVPGTIQTTPYEDDVPGTIQTTPFEPDQAPMPREKVPGAPAAPAPNTAAAEPAMGDPLSRINRLAQEAQGWKEKQTRSYPTLNENPATYMSERGDAKSPADPAAMGSKPSPNNTAAAYPSQSGVIPQPVVASNNQGGTLPPPQPQQVSQAAKPNLAPAPAAPVAGNNQAGVLPQPAAAASPAANNQTGVLPAQPLQSTQPATAAATPTPKPAAPPKPPGGVPGSGG